MELFVEKEKVKLSQEISFISFIKSRYSEIKQIISDFKSSSPKLASQKLPIHMRRRAASHNINRLPSKTRTIIARKGIRKNLNSDQKEKKRKQRKKYQHQNKVELSHAAREVKSDHSLLHLWFVKRFKMINLFNQLIPFYNSTKNQRKLQRMSRKECTHFYFPHFRSIIIRIKNIHLVTQILSKMSKNDLRSFFDNHGSLTINTTWLQFYNSTGVDKIIGPGYLIFNKKCNFLIIWCHAIIHGDIFNHLVDSFQDTLDEVTNGEKIYQFFRLIGSESLFHLKKILADGGSILPDTFEDEKVLTFPNWNFLKNSYNFDESKRIVIKENNFLIIHMTRMNNRDSILLSVPYSEAKDFWYKLVKNRTHLVGGLRDIKILNCEMRQLHYPSIGYPDLEEELNSHRKTWTQIMRLNADYVLLRDQMIISKLKYPYLNISSIQDLLRSHPILNNSLIYVEIISINRGTPKEGDIICLPLEKDIEKYIGRAKIDIKIDQIGYGPVESGKTFKFNSFEQSSRKVIGLVEFGYFSLDLGTGRGFGAITFESLPDLIKFNSKKLIAMIRSNNSNTFRFIEMVIDNFKSF